MAMNQRLAPASRTLGVSTPNAAPRASALDALSQSQAAQEVIQNSGLSGVRKGTTSSAPSGPQAPGPTTDPTQFTFTDADNSKADNYTQSAIDNYNSTQDWTKQAALNALSGSQRLASENSARMGYSPFGASAGANRSQGLVQGINAMNSMMANWARGGSELMMGAAAGARNQAQFTSQGQNQANWQNTQQEIGKVQSQQQTNAAANTASVEAATNQYSGHNYTTTSAAAGAWRNAQQAYADAMKSGDPAAIQAAIAEMNRIADGSNYTADGHSRNDPALKSRIKGYDPKKTVTNSDGSQTIFDFKGNKLATYGPGDAFTYHGT